MSIHVFKQIRTAISKLNPNDIREDAERVLNIGLVASSTAGFTAMENYLVPPGVSEERRAKAMERLHRAGDPLTPGPFDLVLYEQGRPAAPNAFTFWPLEPRRTIEAILQQHPDWGLSLARNFPPFRKPVIDHSIQTVSLENALFALVTGLPNIVPLLELPWAVGEFASDTAFMTINQIRMAFLIAAASDRNVGYREQKGEIASIITSAFGWRAIARELVGKVPLGGGLIPKGAIAYAGTYAVGLSLERYHRIGYAFSRSERKQAYGAAYERGKRVVEALVAGFKRPHAA